MKMWFIVLAVTVSFRVITFMSMLSMKDNDNEDDDGEYRLDFSQFGP